MKNDTGAGGCLGCGCILLILALVAAAGTAATILVALGL